MATLLDATFGLGTGLGRGLQAAWDFGEGAPSSPASRPSASHTSPPPGTELGAGQ